MEYHSAQKIWFKIKLTILGILLYLGTSVAPVFLFILF